MKGETNFQAVSVTVVAMASAAISLFSSATIIVMMGRSRKKLQDSYRRIIFGMSLFDILSSLAVVLKLFKTTSESTNVWLPLGNQVSCRILGFLHIVGTLGSPIYSANLNIYYFYLVQKNMREEQFRKRIEPWLHFVPAFWSIAVGTFLLAAKMINPGQSGACFIAATPLGCNTNSEVDCEGSGDKQFLISLLCVGIPIVLCLIVSFCLLGAIWHKIRSQEQKMDKYRLRRVSVKMQLSLHLEKQDNMGLLTKSNVGSNTNANSSDHNYTEIVEGNDSTFNVAAPVKALIERKSRRQGSNRLKTTPSKSREFFWSAIWYALAFIITFALPFVALSMGMFGMTAPFTVRLLSRLLQPLQGLFNMLVYTRPHVRNYRLLHPDSSWFKGFCYVISKGGDDDRRAEERIGRRSKRRSGIIAARSGARSALSNTPCGSMSSSFGSNAYRNEIMFSKRSSSMFGPVRKCEGPSYNDSHLQKSVGSAKDPRRRTSHLTDAEVDDTELQRSTVPVQDRIAPSATSSTVNLRKSNLSWDLKEAKILPSEGGHDDEKNKIDQLDERNEDEL